MFNICKALKTRTLQEFDRPFLLTFLQSSEDSDEGDEVDYPEDQEGEEELRIHEIAEGEGDWRDSKPEGYTPRPAIPASLPIIVTSATPDSQMSPSGEPVSLSF